MDKSAKLNWEHFCHEADVGVRGYGDTPAQAFEQAALALTATVTDLSLVQASEEIAVECQCEDLELLFVDWLNAVIYEMVTRNMLFNRFDVRIKDSMLQGRIYGEAIERERHQPAVEPKGATYTELKVDRQADGRWLAQCIIDV